MFQMGWSYESSTQRASQGTCLDDFHTGFFQEREFNTWLLEERRPPLNVFKNMKAKGLLASKCPVWRGHVLKQEEGKKETAFKPCILVGKLYYNCGSPKELMNLKYYNDKSSFSSLTS